MPYTNTGKNNMLDALGATHAAAFEGVPGDGGTELDRKAISFGAAAAGVKSATTQPVFDITGGETVNHIAFYDASSGGNLLGYAAVTAENFAGDGTYTLNTADLDLNL